MTPRLEGSPIGNQRGVLVSVSTIPAPCFLKNPISHLRVRAIAFGKALSNPETYRFPLEQLNAHATALTSSCFLENPTVTLGLGAELRADDLLKQLAEELRVGKGIGITTP